MAITVAKKGRAIIKKIQENCYRYTIQCAYVICNEYAQRKLEI